MDDPDPTGTVISQLGQVHMHVPVGLYVTSGDVKLTSATSDKRTDLLARFTRLTLLALCRIQAEATRSFMSGAGYHLTWGFEICNMLP